MDFAVRIRQDVPQALPVEGQVNDGNRLDRVSQKGCCGFWSQWVRLIDLVCHTALFFPMAGLEAAEAWSQLANLKDPELQQLAQEVPDTLERLTVLLRCTLVPS